MIQRMCAAAAVVAAAVGGALLTVPAHADDWSDGWRSHLWSDNRSSDHGSSQSGNTIGDVFGVNRGAGYSTNVNNVNGMAWTATNGGITVTYIFY